MKEEKNTAGRRRSLSRRTFVIIILSVCAIALAAEVALLVHSFASKKADKKKSKETKEFSAEAEKTEKKQGWKPAKISYYITNRVQDGETANIIPVSETTLEYDERGNEIRSTYKSAMGDKSVTQVRYEKGGILYVTGKIGDENTDLNGKKLTFFAKNRRELISFRADDFEITYDRWEYWKEISYDDGFDRRIGISLTYDEKGRLSQEVNWEEAEGSEREILQQADYQYADDGEDNYTITESRKGRPGQYAYEYQDGKLLQTTILFIDENLKAVQTSVNKYEYRDKGKLLICSEYDSKGQLTYESRTWYPNLLDIFDISFDMGTPMADYTYQAIWDEKENLTEIKLISPDSTSSTLTAEYDDEGRLKAYWERGSSNYFVYDENGNLTEVRTITEEDGFYQTELTLIEYILIE